MTFNNMGGRGEMIKAPTHLQELRRKIYLKAKANKSWRFWGLYVHVCKYETLYEAYRLAKANNGSPGIDGVTFAELKESGIKQYLLEIQEELKSGTYKPMPNRKCQIPKSDTGKFRVLEIPTIKDRIVQGALKLILEPIFDSDFQSGSFGYRPKRTAHQAVKRVAQAIASRKANVIDVDLKDYFNTIKHDKLLAKIATRINDANIMRLTKQLLKMGGKKGVAQGSVISPLFSNIYLNEIDIMLEKAIETTRKGEYTHIEYARYADDLVILVDYHPKWERLRKKVMRRLKEELHALSLTLNEEKTKIVNLENGGSFNFLGYNFRQRKTLNNKLGVLILPTKKARKALLTKLKPIFKNLRSQPIAWVINKINPILRGWANYYRIANVNKVFNYVRGWVDRKVRRHMMRARLRGGFGWKRWSSDYIYNTLGLYNDYEIRYAA